MYSARLVDRVAETAGQQSGATASQRSFPADIPCEEEIDIPRVEEIEVHQAEAQLMPQTKVHERVEPSLSSSTQADLLQPVSVSKKAVRVIKKQIRDLPVCDHVKELICNLALAPHLVEKTGDPDLIRAILMCHASFETAPKAACNRLKQRVLEFAQDCMQVWDEARPFRGSN